MAIVLTSRDSWEKTPFPSTSLTSSSQVSSCPCLPLETTKMQGRY